MKRGDLGFALGIVMIMVVLIMGVPKWLLDISLAMSITLSVLIMMTIVFIQKALEFNSFPVRPEQVTAAVRGPSAQESRS